MGKRELEILTAKSFESREPRPGRPARLRRCNKSISGIIIAFHSRTGSAHHRAARVKIFGFSLTSLLLFANERDKRGLLTFRSAVHRSLETIMRAVLSTNRS